MTQVRTPEEFNEAAQHGGEVILAPDFDGGLFLKRSPASPLTVSGLPGHRVSSLLLHEVADVTLSGLNVKYDFQVGDVEWLKVGIIRNSRNVRVEGCWFVGDVAHSRDDDTNGTYTAFGLQITECLDVSIVHNLFKHLYRGISSARCTNINISDNEITELRMDGLISTAHTGVVIERNHIHSFASNGVARDHCDMIQFFTNGQTVPSTGIRIRDNWLDRGLGRYTQSIFMRNEEVDRGRQGDEMLYSDVIISGNVIVNGHVHGITLGEARDVEITDNTLLHTDGDTPDGEDASVEVPRINLKDPRGKFIVTRNVVNVHPYVVRIGNWPWEGNLAVQDQDPEAAGWYGGLFADSFNDVVDGRHQVRWLEGVAPLGSPLLFDPAPEVDPEPEGAPITVTITPAEAATLNSAAAILSKFGTSAN